MAPTEVRQLPCSQLVLTAFTRTIYF